MRLKGKLLKWNDDKAFGFIAPNGGGDHVFIHKSALSNRHRTPRVNDVITFSISKDKHGRYCADEATFSGEKLKKKQAKKVSKFSIFLSVISLSLISIAYLLEQLPQKLFLIYIVASVITFLAYASDKSKAQRGAFRTPENSLHTLSLIGGWPGAGLAQQLLRHKTQKKEFRLVFWITVILNSGAFTWLFTPTGQTVLKLFS